jgi:hypothetical protein
MPQVNVLLYREDDGSVPLIEWLATLPAEARDRCQDFSTAFGLWPH